MSEIYIDDPKEYYNAMVTNKKVKVMQETLQFENTV